MRVFQVPLSLLSFLKDSPESLLYLWEERVEIFNEGTKDTKDQQGKQFLTNACTSNYNFINKLTLVQKQLDIQDRALTWQEIVKSKTHSENVSI